MARDGFDYGRLMQRAFRGLMVEVLGKVAERGLPGAHHFFISFDTRHPGVDMPDWLRADYPEELAIVLQHEFYDLAVTGDRFSVALSFKDRTATLVVPFDAVTTFADPSQNFGLRFDAMEEGERKERSGERPKERAGEPAGGRPAEPAPLPRRDKGERAAPEGDKPAGDAEVISIDRFRKR